MPRTAPAAAVTEDSSVNPVDLSTSVASYFRHNWESPVTVRTEWKTLVRSSQLRTKEQRLGAWSRPRTTVGTLHQAMDQRQLQLLLQHTNDLGPRYTVPVNTATTLLSGTGLRWAGAIHSDVAEIVSVTPRAQGGFQLGANLTAGYRYYPGGRVWVVSPDFKDLSAPGGLSAPAVLHTMVDPTGRQFITVDEVPGFTPQPGMLIVPAIDCVPVLTVDGSNPSELTPTINIEAVEALGTNQLPSAFPYQFGIDVEDLPSIGGPYNGHPIFDPDHNYREAQGWGFTRSGSGFSLGNRDSFVLEGERSRSTSTFTISAERLAFWNFKMFFDHRRGSLLPFWVVTGTLLLGGYSHPGGTSVPLLPDAGTQFVDTIAFKPVGGGDAVIRKLAAPVASGDSDMTLSESLPAGNYDMYHAYLGRFTEDYIDEEWLAQDYAECTFETIEVFDDSDQQISQPAGDAGGTSPGTPVTP